MADSDDTTALWPGSPYDLADTHLCPACFETLAHTTCDSCGLVLTDPRAVRLLEFGRAMVDIEDQRQQLIDEIRLAHRVIPAPVPPAPVAPAETVRTPEPAVALASAAAEAPVLLQEPAPVAPPVAPTAVEPPVGGTSVPATTPVAASVVPPAPRRRLTVPVLLLIVGVSLVGVAAVFFLGLAWFVAGILVRALIIGGITVAVIAGASLLRRGSLRATAEAIGALGVILLALDAYALRANDFFGAGGVDPFVYAGVSALVVGVLCRLWSTLSRLRGPDLAATLALPAGAGLLVGGLLPVDATAAVTAGLLGAAAGGLLHALPAPWSAARRGADAIVERTALAVIGIAALAVAAGIALVTGLGSPAAQSWAAAAIVVLGAAHALLLWRPTGDEAVPAADALGAAAASIAAVVAASFGWQLARFSDQPVYPELVAPVLAVAVAVGLDRWARPGARMLAPRIAAAAVGVGSIIALMLGSILRGERVISASWVLWQTDVFASSLGAELADAILAASAGLVAAVLLFLAPTLGRTPLRDIRPIAAVAVLLAGATGTGIPAAIAGAGIVVVAVALVALARGASRIGWGVAAGLGAVTAFVAGLASPWLWAIGVFVAVAVPLAARRIVRPGSTGGVALALTSVVAATASALIAPEAVASAAGVISEPRAAAALVQWVAVAVLGSAVLLRLDAATRTALAVAAYALTAFSLITFVAEPVSGPTVSAAIGEPAAAIARSALLLVLLGAVALRRTRVADAPALAAAGLLAPIAACVAAAVADTFDAANDPAVIGIVAAAVAVVSLGALVPTRLYGSRATEVTAERADAASPTGPEAERADAASPTGPEAELAPGAMSPVPTAPGADPVAPRAPTGFPVLARRFADLGAFTTIAVVAWAVSAELRWVPLALVALAFAGASVARGWAGTRAGEPTGLPETRATGATVDRAPRRVLVWPAFAAATLALWSWLDRAGSFEIEAFVLPPATGLLAFTALLVWLRRRAEATIAIVLSFGFGLIVPAVVALGGAPLRGLVVALISAALAVALAWTPLRRVRATAVAGAATAIVALAIVALARGVFDPVEPAWALLLIGTAYAAALGFAGVLPGRTLPASADPGAWFAILVPALSLGVGVCAVAPSLDDPIVVAVALGVLCLLHLASAALHRLPLAATTRWTAFGGAVVVAAVAYARGDIDAVELVSVPLAAALLGGAALAMWRRAHAGEAWPGGERIAWLVGLALAVVPSVVAEPNDPRTWLVIAGALLAAIGCVVAPVPDSAGLKTPSAVLLSACALAIGVRALFEPGVESGEFAAVAAGVGALLIAAAAVWMDDADARPLLVVGLGAAGAVLLLATIGVESDGGLVRTTVTAAVAGVIGVGGAALLGVRKWAGLGAVLALAGLAGALLAAATRYATLLTQSATGVEPDLWALVGLGITAAIGVMALRSSRAPAVAPTVGAVFSIVLVLFAVAELLLLGNGDPDADALRAVLTMSAITVAGLTGVVHRARLGLALALSSAVAAAVFGLIALTFYAVRPIELVTVPVAVGMVLIGARRLRRDAAVRTWPALGPGLALLTLPSLAYDFGESELWRVVALGLVAVALVVVGAVWKLQAPLILGSAVLLVHAAAQLWPWISDVYVAVPWWLWLGIGGALLIYIAARYEKRMRALRAAFTAVASLR